MTAAAGRQLSGLEFLRAISSGQLPGPPISITLGFRLLEVDEGRALFVVQPGRGSTTITLLEWCTAGWRPRCSILLCRAPSQTTLPAGVGYTTLEIKVNFVRPITLDSGELRCEGKVVHGGSRTATAEGQLLDQAGKLYAHGTTTCIILRP